MRKLFKNQKNMFYALIIAMVIEVFVCNFGFFRTIYYGNNNFQIDYSINGNSIIISDINFRTTSINIEYKDKLTDKITYNIYYVAEENSDKISLNPKVIQERGKHYVNFDTHSECKTIEIDFITNSNINIKNIILNHPNFNLNIIRMILIFCGIFFVLQMKSEEICKSEYNKDSKTQNIMFVINLCFFCIFLAIYTLCQIGTEYFFVNREKINKEDSLLMQTEAFMNGQIKLLEEPTDKLKSMENPYDNIKRNEQGINYLFDVAYYKGSYYNYFGIAPILTSILPFRIITGMYTHTYIFNMIYIFSTVFALYFLYKKLLDIFIKKLSLCNFYLGFYSILFASNIFTLLRGEKYDIVISSGILFLIISLNLAISIINNTKYKYIKLITLGITTALIVLSKPNFIIYYVLIFFFIIKSIKNLKIEERIRELFLLFIPLAGFAIFQMILNYIRFDNIFEFGAKYQLTNFNMISCMSITCGKVYAGIVEYIFRTPSINPLKFPFIFINTDTNLLSINEVCYENRLIGLISIPILYGYILKRNIIKKNDNKELNLFINICLITSILSIIISTCFGGICETYSIDFKLILAIGAVIILLKWLENNEKKEEINKIFIILCISTIIIMVPISLTTERDFLINFNSDITIYFKNIFEFWC